MYKRLSRDFILALRRMPLWVQVWVVVLGLVALSCLAFLDTTEGRWAAVALLVILVGNGLLLWRDRGLSRLMGLPHLLAWMPLMIYLSARLLTDGRGPKMTYAEQPTLYVWTLTYLATITLSVMFDVADVARYMLGDKNLIRGHHLDDADLDGKSETTEAGPVVDEASA